MDHWSSKAPGREGSPGRSVWSTWWPFRISLLTCPAWWLLANHVSSRYPLRGPILLLPLFPFASYLGALGAWEARQWIPLTILFQMPVLAFGGEATFGPMIGAVMRCVADNVEEVIIPDCGHWITEEQPQATTDLVVDFLNRR